MTVHDWWFWVVWPLCFTLGWNLRRIVAWVDRRLRRGKPPKAS